MTEIKDIGLVGETTAKFMDTLEKALGEMENPSIQHVCVIADVSYTEDGVACSHVILDCDVDSRIIQIGITTSAQAAALFGDPLGAEGDKDD